MEKDLEKAKKEDNLTKIKNQIKEIRKLFKEGIIDKTKENFVLINGEKVLQMPCFFPDKRLPLIINNIKTKKIFLNITEELSKIYGNVDCFIFQNEKIFKKTIKEILENKKTIKEDEIVLIIPSADTLNNKTHDISDLYLIMKRLRSKDGCKWDIAQTNKSIAINAIEEAYELVDAIECSDDNMIIEESGDVLLQAVFHAIIAEDEKRFTIREVLTALSNKLIARHTHIFGDRVATNEKEAILAWNEAKDKEKRYKNTVEKMNQVPKNMPALLKAEKIIKIDKKTRKQNEKENSTDEVLKKYREKNSIEEKNKIAGELLLELCKELVNDGISLEGVLNETLSEYVKRY